MGRPRCLAAIALLLVTISCRGDRSAPTPTATSDAGATAAPVPTASRDAARTREPLLAEMAEPACDAGSCAPVPRGIRGLRFGMTVEEARRALAAPWFTESHDDDGDDDGEGGDREPDSPVYLASTTLGRFWFQCQLTFGVAQRLSIISCELDDEAQAPAAAQEMLRHLTARYGRPRQEGAGAGDRQELTWSDTHAQLVLEIFDERLPEGSVIGDVAISNVSAEHLAAISRAEEEERKQEEARERAEEALREATAERPVSQDL